MKGSTYSVFVEIVEFTPNRVYAIKAAVEQVWPIKFWDTYKDQMTSVDTLGTAFIDEAELAEAIINAVWKANQSYCYVNVHMLCMDSLPYEFFESCEEEYDAFLEEKDG